MPNGPARRGGAAFRDVEAPEFGLIIRDVPDTMSDEEVIRRALKMRDVPTGVRDPELARRQTGLPPLMTPELRAEELGRATGLPVAPGELEGGLRGFRARFRLGSPPINTIVERAQTLQDHYPNAEVRIAANQAEPDKSTVLIRPQGVEDFVELDSAQVGTFNDVADFLGQAVSGETLGAVLGFIANRNAPGLMGMVVRSLGIGAGTGVGFYAQSELERLLGTERDPRMRAAGDAAVIGAMAGAAGLLFEPLAAVGRGARGMAMVRAELPDLRELQDWAMGRGMFGLSPADVHPMLRSVLLQAIGTGLKAERARLSQLASVATFMSKEAERIGPAGDVPTSVLAEVLEKQRLRLLKIAGAPRRVSRREQGRAVARGLADFTRLRKEVEDRLFTDVRRLAVEEDVIFNLRGAKSVADDVLEGVQARTVPEVSSLRSLVPFGIVPGGPEATQGTMRLGFLDQRLRQLANQIKALDPDIKSFTDRGRFFNAYDQIRTIRTELFNLKDRLDDKVQQRLASQLHSALKQAMDTPIAGRLTQRPSGVFTSQFSQTLKKANKWKTQTEQAFDHLHTRELWGILEESGPGRAGAMMIDSAYPDRPGQIKGILKSAGRMEDWETVRAGWLSRLLERNPKAILRELDKEWDREALNVLLSPDEQKHIRSYARHVSITTDKPAEKIIREQTNIGVEALEKLLREDAEALGRLVADAGGKDTLLGRRLQKGLLQELLSRSQRMEMGELIILPQALAGNIQRVLETGKAQIILSPENLATLKNLQKLVSFFQRMGMGEGLQKSEAAAGVFAGRPSAVGVTLRNYWFARLMFSKPARKMLAKTPEIPPELRRFRTVRVGEKVARGARRAAAGSLRLTEFAPLLNAMATSAARDIEREIELEEEKTPPPSRLDRVVEGLLGPE